MPEVEDLVPCVFIIKVDGARGFNVKADHDLRKTAHKMAVMMQEEVILASGKLTDVAFREKNKYGRGDNAYTIYECTCKLVQF